MIVPTTKYNEFDRNKTKIIWIKSSLQNNFKLAINRSAMHNNKTYKNIPKYTQNLLFQKREHDFIIIIIIL